MSDPHGVFRVDISSVQIQFDQSEKSSVHESTFHLALNFDQFWKGETQQSAIAKTDEWDGVLRWERIAYFTYSTSQIHRLSTKLFDVNVIETDVATRTSRVIAIVHYRLQSLALGPMLQQVSIQTPRRLSVESFVHMECITPVWFQLSNIRLSHLPPTPPFVAIRCRVCHNQNKSRFIEFDIKDEDTVCAEAPLLQIEISLQEALNGSLCFTFYTQAGGEGGNLELGGFCEYPVKKHVMESVTGDAQEFRHTIDHHVMSIGIISGCIKVSNLPMFSQMKGGCIRDGGCPNFFTFLITHLCVHLSLHFLFFVVDVLLLQLSSSKSHEGFLLLISKNRRSLAFLLYF
eukprot:TRINITY_DN703_c0_g3_i7.p1 TRINITY_DN703_c0_g3~~TRINITY_DN703_c0_g3_i7.p1  ORF type:complete len:345 (+),score=67.55 TRINITY_DN703_c0_g3_i7:61-1095(+)